MTVGVRQGVEWTAVSQVWGGGFQQSCGGQTSLAAPLCGAEGEGGFLFSALPRLVPVPG